MTIVKVWYYHIQFNKTTTNYIICIIIITYIYWIESEVKLFKNIVRFLYSDHLNNCACKCLFYIPLLS